MSDTELLEKFFEYFGEHEHRVQLHPIKGEIGASVLGWEGMHLAMIREEGKLPFREHLEEFFKKYPTAQDWKDFKKKQYDFVEYED